jgi:hypothetical protein
VCLEAMAAAEWDVLLLAGRYTLLEQAPLDDLLPLCVRAGTSVVIGGPLNSGILAGRDTWNYAAAPPDVVARARAIGAVCERHGVPLPAAALQFPGAPGGGRHHPRAALGGGVHREPGSAAPADPGGAVAGVARAEPAARGGADAMTKMLRCSRTCGGRPYSSLPPLLCFAGSNAGLAMAALPVPHHVPETPQETR